ncbi:hypothetical protein M406DRAFT_323091 [Cryphonectria parasitica EP155]|uniref:Uncharacterized protein n=1 Tax=Cryphonectria parasitica (strain ATCC 38755 / EP155) TaxID=660469 RepID=A0A9P4XXS9_CRYP1|nr:uncharacterized protein M406DRAFT_323091 [Cryphonectria parasitica EP155]KAF3763312.1 hypothetical protein M406DRAFT_323091 [Cryphonectria parasitica EP155]
MHIRLLETSLLLLVAGVSLAHSPPKHSTTTTAKTSTSTTATTHSSTTAAPASTSTASTSTVSIPASCTSDVPPALTMTAFTWFNSTHNLDCVNPNYPAGSTVCWNSTSLCSEGDANCVCTPFCYTGLSSAAYQPLGYGPPDSIDITIDGGTCYQVEPKGYRDYELGEGHFDCGSAADQIGFYGNSNSNTGNVGSVYYNAYYATGVGSCNDQIPSYGASFPLECTRDQGGNATCTAPVPIVLPLTGWV